MSTSSTKVSKQSKKVKEEINSDMESSDIENDKHSIFNGDFKKNPNEAKYFIKHFNAISEEFLDSDSKSKVLKHIWGESYESLEELIKKSNKKEKTMKAKFVPTDIEKPSKPIDIFGKKFSEESKEKGVKFGKENNYLVCRKAAWDKLTEKEQNKYVKQAEKLLEEYNTEFARQKAEAIENGDFPEDKLKGPCTAYFLFLADVRPKLTEQFKNDSDKNTKITKEGGKLWKALSDEEKEKYTEAYRKSKAEYDIKKQEWNSNETDRLKKQDNKPVDVKIESSGNKKTEKPEKVVKSTKAVKAEKDVDSEVEDVKPAKSKPTKEKASKPSKKVEVKTESEDNDDSEVEIEDIKVEVKPKAKAKPAKSSRA